jgi:formylmethanofuran dehydrogenase subunit E
MPRHAFLIWLCTASLCLAEDRLPQPHFHPHTDDPAWLATLVQFHGHLGPSAVAGARLGMAGLHAVEAEGYFDVEVTCEGPLAQPPQACFLDGLQVATGATLGKRSLQWVQADDIIVRVKNTQTGRTAIVRPSATLLRLLAPVKSKLQPDASRSEHPVTHGPLEAVARRIAVMPQDEILSVEIEQ